MFHSIKVNDQSFVINNEMLDISIPLNFGGEQPNAYGVEPARSEPYQAGELIGDTRRGGSCNFEQYTFIPHCNGTHTECVGHITDERISVLDCLTDVFISAVLVSLTPEIVGADLILSENSLSERLKSPSYRRANDKVSENTAPTALIVRTLPNDDSKRTREYGAYVPPYFTSDAMKFIVSLDFKHLLVDMPSIDRIYDDGKLANHRIFWNIEPGGREINPATRVHSTITEMIYVPNEVEDGEYLLNLQIAPFASDASPSRPVLSRPGTRTSLSACLIS